MLARWVLREPNEPLSTRRWRFWLAGTPWLFFAMIAGALALATLFGAGFAWDGSYVFFELLDKHAPFVNNRRWSNFLLQLPAAAISHLTDNIPTLSLFYSVPYIFIPLVALVASWLVVRRSQPHLFVWPVLGIGLATLPGQLCFVCDSIIAVHLFWPVLLSTVVAITPRTAILTTVLALMVFYFHPFSIVLFAIGGAASLLVWMQDKKGRPGNFYVSLFLFALLVLRMIVTVIDTTDYEKSQSSWDVAVNYFMEYVWGFPLASLVFAWAVGYLLLLPTLRPSNHRYASKLSMACVAIAGTLLVFLALNHDLWMDALSFRQFAIVSSLPFLLLAILEACVPRFLTRADAAGLVTSRYPIMNGVGIVFAVVLSLQSFGFWHATNDLRAYLSATSEPCIDRDSLTMIQGTALDHWTLPTYVIVLQGKTPESLVLDAEGCLIARGTGPLQLVPFKEYAGGNWFDLTRVRSAIPAGEPCQFILSDGWHQHEEASWGWWRWSPGRGVVRVFVEHETTAILQAQIQSASLENHMDIVVNGEQQVMFLPGREPQSFRPIRVRLAPGENIIEFISANPPVMSADDPRPLAIAVANLRLTMTGESGACERLS
jgi:hypothetical protein